MSKRSVESLSQTSSVEVMVSIHNRNIYKGAALAALLVSLFTVGNSYGLPFAFIDVLPLSSYQLNWILPAVIGGLIGALIRTDHKAEGSAYSMEKGT